MGLHDLNHNLKFLRFFSNLVPTEKGTGITNQGEDLQISVLIFYIFFTLELRQIKDDSIQSKEIPTLKLARFLITYTVKEKARQFQN